MGGALGHPVAASLPDAFQLAEYQVKDRAIIIHLSPAKAERAGVVECLGDPLVLVPVTVSGAAAFAALLSGVFQPAASERVGVVVCGANTTAVELG